MAYLLEQLLTETASRAPDAEAIRYEGAALTYRQLDEQSNQLARALGRAGVGRGDRVALYLPKTLGAVVGAFGILKAGAAYVPIDVGAPPARSAYIARNCGVRAVVTSGSVKSLPRLLSEVGSVEAVVLVDGAAPPPAAEAVIGWHEVQAEASAALPPSGAIDTDLAYILYTSGSTGEPKGVMISHRASLTFVSWSGDAFGLSSTDRVTSHAPLHFDLSIFDIYATVRAGGTVVLVPEVATVLPAQLTELLAVERVTVTYLVPSVLKLMVEYGALAARDLSALRTVLFAGEVLPIRYLRQLASALPDATFHNLFGPTETNVCTAYSVQPGDLRDDRTAALPIGVACANTDVFAVDDGGRRVTEPGLEGELWVRGSGLASGYWGDEEKTAARFVRNPFEPHRHEVVYRTGDIVTLAEDRTNWLYLGRRDHMVKSRGYRIELGEIEAALYRHDGVSEAAVAAIPDDLIGNRIVAYVVSGDAAVTVRDLEAHCAAVLPRYMVPDRFELSDGLPRTSTGKVDRPALVTQEQGDQRWTLGAS